MTGPRQRTIVLLSLLTVLFGAVGAELYMTVTRHTAAGRIGLPENLLALASRGVDEQNLPLGATEALDASAKETLGFDAYIYKRFRFRERTFLVYVAHWPADGKSFLDVATHVPDNCWVANGWRLTSRVAPVGAVHAESVAGLPVEYRTFSSPSDVEHVAYWHICGGRGVSYRKYGTGKTIAFLWDNRDVFWGYHGDQYLVRISSHADFEKWWNDPLFNMIIADIRLRLTMAGSNERRSGLNNE